MPVRSGSSVVTWTPEGYRHTEYWTSDGQAGYNYVDYAAPTAENPFYLDLGGETVIQSCFGGGGVSDRHRAFFNHCT